MNNNTPSLYWQSQCGTYTVRIKRRAFDTMLRLAKAHAPLEVGTSLVGTYSDDGNQAIVCGLAPLTPDSKGSHFSFTRGVLGLTDFFHRVFHRFRGRRHYVGEWHSHPNAAPYPSSTDNANNAQIADDGDTDCPEAILLIVGGDFSATTQLGAYVYSRSHGRITLTPY